MERGKGVKSLKKVLADNPKFVMLDMSQINSFETCHRKYWYVYRKHLSDPVGPGALFSSMFLHPLLSRWYESQGSPIPDSTITKTFKLFAAAVVSNGNSIRGADEYSRDYATLAMTNYIRAYDQDFVMYSVESCEEVYWATIPGMPGFVFVSKPDLVLSQRSNKQLVTVDFKASKYEFNRTLIPFDRQFIGQAVVVGAKFMMKNFLHLSTNHGNVICYRDFIPIDDDLVAEWKAELIVTLKEFELTQQSDIWVKRSPQGCYPFPNVQCSFMNYCTLGSARHKMIEQAEKVNNLSYLGL